MQDPFPDIAESQILTRKKASVYAKENTALPRHILLIAADAFAGKNKICCIRFPPYLVAIHPRAFQSCLMLREAVLPHSLRELGKSAFADCSGLQRVRISNQLPVIEKETFRNDRKLQYVLFTTESVLTRIKQQAFMDCTALESMQFPPRLSVIEDRAFYRCKSLKTVSFPDGLISIGREAFYFCGMDSLELPDSLEVLEDSAFFKCTYLTEVRLPPHIKYIGKWVFHGCSRLKVLEIRNDPEYIGEWIINRAARIRCYRGSKVDAYCQASGFTVEYMERR